MQSIKGKARPGQSKKQRQLIKIIENSDSDDDSEHELSHYLNDRVKMMKQVIKIIKPKKMKSMAPDSMKGLDIEEINSRLLEELLGISNKRLKMIFAGQIVDEDTSSSTDPEEEKKPIDIISLDDVTDDDFVIEIDSSNEESTHGKKHKKIKEEPPEKKIKKEKKDKAHKRSESARIPEKSEEENLMSVLELLELQARARAIKSQLALEASRKAQVETERPTSTKTLLTPKEPLEASDEDDAIIVQSPSFDEIIITSSESDNENNLQLGKGKNTDREYDNEETDTTNNGSIKDDNSNPNLVCHSSENITAQDHASKDSTRTSPENFKSKGLPRKHKHMCRKRYEKMKALQHTSSRSKDSLEDEEASKSDFCRPSASNNYNNNMEDDNNESTNNKDTIRITRPEDSSKHDEQVLILGDEEATHETDKKTTSDRETTEATEIEVDEKTENITIKEGGINFVEVSMSHTKTSCSKDSPDSSRAETKEEIHLHSHQEGLVINIDDDDIDAINS